MSESETTGVAGSHVDLTVVERVERTYRVLATDEDEARRRLHLFWRDPQLLREGIVERGSDEEVTHRQVKPKPKSGATTGRRASGESG